MKRWSCTLAGAMLLIILGAQQRGFAHAVPDHTDPRVGSDVAHAPTEVRIWYTQAVEPSFSTIQVFSADGKEVDKKDAHVDPKNKSLLIVSLPPLPAGTYKVVWRVVSIDTHKTHGDFKFTIKP